MAKARATQGTIYGIQFLDDGLFYYVGQTRLPLAKRWAEHRKPTCKAFVSKALQTFGVDKFTIVVLEIARVEMLNEREGYWIETLGTLAPFGLNRRTGGFVSSMSETSRQRMSDARKKLWADPEFRAKTTAALRASWQSAPRRAQARETQKRAAEAPGARARRIRGWDKRRAEKAGVFG